MTKYKITISYDGSKYRGLQKLRSENTIQGELENVLTTLNEKKVKVLSSGRTDRGVHALGQVCSFELQKSITTYRLRYYLNRMTSKYLYVDECIEIKDDLFHPRFSCKKKIYKYLINAGKYDPIRADYVYNYNKSLNLAKMKKASKIFLGPHNFKAFVVGKHKTYDSIIEDIIIKREKDDISISIIGKAFYTYMVRYIVSALILVGEGSIDDIAIQNMLDKGIKTLEFAPAPPEGLYLIKVEY